MLPDDYTLLLAGYGSELENLQHYAYTVLKLSQERVQFMVRPTKEELRILYSQADLFVYASTTETQGLVMLEAMACGTPVVALYGPGQQDFVNQGINGYLVNTAHQMIEIIQNIKENKALQASLRQGALHTAQDYKPEVIVKKLVDVYKKQIDEES